MKFLTAALVLMGLIVGCASTEQRKHGKNYSHSHGLKHGGHEHSNRHPSGEEDDDHEQGSQGYHDHSEAGVKLPDVSMSMFNDLNENGKIDEDEISEDNLLPELGGATAFSKKPIVALGLQRGQLTLTIDDGPREGLTQLILDLLDDYKIKATFFVTGSRIKAHAHIIRELERRGHTIGNHTFSHDVRNITSTTIGNEILKAYNELVEALGHAPEGRLLFRAPGLSWSTPKATNLNAGEATNKFIGPIHANLGTDAPKADWHCWSHGKSATTCADYYFDVITRKGRGIILAHDIAYGSKSRNTYQMLKILFEKLEAHGGIKNLDGSGVWEFVSLADRSALDKLDEGVLSSAPIEEGPENPFSRGDVNVRSERIRDDLTSYDNSSKIPLVGGGGVLQTRHIQEYTDLNESVVVKGLVFKKVRIIKMMPGEELPDDVDVYIWERAFR